MVRAGHRQARPQVAAERRRSGVRQQFRRRCPDGPGRDGARVGRLCRGPMVLGTDRAGDAVDSPRGRQLRQSTRHAPLAQLSRHQSRSGRRPGAARAGVDSRRSDRPSKEPSWLEFATAASRRTRPARRPRRTIRPTAGIVAGRKRLLAGDSVRPRLAHFAGNPQRNKIAAPLVDVGAVAWRIPLAALPGCRRRSPAAARPSAKIPANR